MRTFLRSARLAALIGLLLAGSNAFAADNISLGRVSPSARESWSLPGRVLLSARENRSPVRIAQNHWHFLGCVASEHQCADLAHSQGYHHHQIVDDHHGQCHHEPVIYACLGGN